jgi:hypothetical protein
VEIANALKANTSFRELTLKGSMEVKMNIALRERKHNPVRLDLVEIMNTQLSVTGAFPPSKSAGLSARSCVLCVTSQVHKAFPIGLLKRIC